MDCCVDQDEGGIDPDPAGFNRDIIQVSCTSLGRWIVVDEFGGNMATAVYNKP